MDDFEKALNDLEKELEFDSQAETGELSLEELGNETVSQQQSIQDHCGIKLLEGIQTDVDIVFCIDVTLSMTPVIDKVKALTLSLDEKLILKMKKDGQRPVRQLRVRVIAFRDYYCDGEYSMQESDFFTLPAQKREFHDFVNSLEAKGGGDEPENALEALALAMKSDWVKVADRTKERDRNVIVMFTDASAHKFEVSSECSKEALESVGYPEDMMKNYKELYDAWNFQQPGLAIQNTGLYDMSKYAKRLVLFAPEDVYPWSDMVEEFEQLSFVHLDPGNGGKELNEDVIIATICGSFA